MQYRVRSYGKTDAYEKGISLTYDPCMLTWLKSKDTHRGIMSCGHTIDPNNLFSYMYYCVLKGLYQIKCPYIDPVDPNKRCNQIWSYQELRKMALLNTDEKDFFEI